MVKVLDEMDTLYDLIYKHRVSIAELKKDKIEKRSVAWKDASAIKLAKEKEDFVRGKVADIQEKIDVCEATIEKAYGKLKIAELKLEHGDE